MSIITFIVKLILRRSRYKGQFRLFNLLFKKGILNTGKIISSPHLGNFKIECDTSTWIGASIAYLGDYEGPTKNVFKTHIKEGDVVLDVGANVGFHSLFFSELVGRGEVIAFEPVPTNYLEFRKNIQLNKYSNIHLETTALSNRNETFEIPKERNFDNPGAFNLFDKGEGFLIDCKIGDEYLAGIKVDFIKIDVEGYEIFVLMGLCDTIKRHKPKIVFEYDINYQKRNDVTINIFHFLSDLNYHFYEISNKGVLLIKDFSQINCADILALQN